MIKLARFRDLKERGIVDSWAQLDNLIKKCGFPPGRMLSPKTRVWDEENEIEPWFAAARPKARPRAAPRRSLRAARLRTASAKPPAKPPPPNKNGRRVRP